MLAADASVYLNLEALALGLFKKQFEFKNEKQSLIIALSNPRFLNINPYIIMHQIQEPLCIFNLPEMSITVLKCFPQTIFQLQL